MNQKTNRRTFVPRPRLPRLLLSTRLSLVLSRIRNTGRRLRSRLPRIVWPESRRTAREPKLQGPLIVMMCSEAYGCERYRYPSLDHAVAGLTLLARYAYKEYLIDGVEREFRIIPENAVSETHGPPVHK